MQKGKHFGSIASAHSLGYNRSRSTTCKARFTAWPAVVVETGTILYHLTVVLILIPQIGDMRVQSEYEQQEKIDIRHFQRQTIENLRLYGQFVDQVARELDPLSRDMLKVASEKTLVAILKDLLPERYLLPKDLIEEIEAQPISTELRTSFERSIREYACFGHGLRFTRPPVAEVTSPRLSLRNFKRFFSRSSASA